MKIKMPAQAAKVIQTLEQHGFEAYIVGGCVRDSILGRTPGDWDITTSASPQEVKEIIRSYGRYRNRTWNSHGFL